MTIFLKLQHESKEKWFEVTLIFLTLRPIQRIHRKGNQSFEFGMLLKSTSVHVGNPSNEACGIPRQRRPGNMRSSSDCRRSNLREESH